MQDTTVVEWDNATKTIIRCDFQRMMTWEAFYAAQQAIIAHLDQSSGTADVILNFTAVAYLPSGIMLQFNRIAERYPHRKRRFNVIVGANFFLKTMVMLFAKFQQVKEGEILFADSLDQARVLLAKRH